MQLRRPTLSWEERLIQRLLQPSQSAIDVLDPTLATLEPVEALKLLTATVERAHQKKRTNDERLAILAIFTIFSVIIGNSTVFTLGVITWFVASMIVLWQRPHRYLLAQSRLLLPLAGREGLAPSLQLLSSPLWSAAQIEKLLPAVTRMLGHASHTELRAALTPTSRAFLRKQLSQLPMDTVTTTVASLWEAFAAAALIALFEIHDAETRSIAKRWAKQMSFPTPKLCELARECLRTRGDAIL